MSLISWSYWICVRATSRHSCQITNIFLKSGKCNLQLVQNPFEKNVGCLQIYNILQKTKNFVVTSISKGSYKLPWKAQTMVVFSSMTFIPFFHFVFWDRFYIFTGQNFIFLSRGVGVGRGSIYNWWIYRHIFRFLYNEEIMKMYRFPCLVTKSENVAKCGIHKRTVTITASSNLTCQNTGGIHQSLSFSYHCHCYSWVSY